MKKFSLSKEIDPSAETATLTITGYLDAETVSEVMKAIEDLFSKKIYKIVVDLERLEYIASIGISAFLSNTKESRENGGDIVLLNPTPQVSKVFTLLGFQKFFKIITDREKAFP